MNIKPYITFLLISGILLIQPLLLSAEENKIRVAVTEADIRLEPNINSAVMAQIPLGAVLEVRQKKGEWYEVNLPPDDRGFIRRGFIHADFVEIVKDKNQEKKVEPIRQERIYQTSPRSKPMRRGPGFKLMGGLSFGSIYHSGIEYGGYDESEWKKYQMGLSGGLGMESGGSVGLEIDILYLQKGVSYQGETDFQGQPLTAEFNLILNEISAPVMLKIKFTNGSTPFILVGGEIAYILSSKVNWSYSFGTTSQSGIEDTSENTNMIDYSAVFGAGFEFNMGGAVFVIEGRYHHGLANLVKESGYTAPEDWVKTKAIVLMGGIRF